MRKGITDIHNHSLCCVDDGAHNRQEAVAMLEAAAQQGVETVILTPHYRHGMFAYDKEEIEEQYNTLTETAEEIGIRLFLGCEYHVNSEILQAFQTGRCHSLADSDYVLTEYSYQTEFAYICQYTNQLLSCGYIPVIAHAERYACIQKKPELCAKLSAMGAIIQLNADSVLGIDGRIIKHICKKILKQRIAHIIASDAHGIKERPNHIGSCYDYVAKKYGEEYADKLFCHNPGKIVREAERK